MTEDATTIHDQLQVAIAEAWSSEDREGRQTAAVLASTLAAKLWRLVK